MKPLDGILKGTDSIIDRHLLIPSPNSGRSYRHKGEASKINPEFDAEKMLVELIAQIKGNLKRCSTSTENWREILQPNLNPLNKSEEVVLERKIAQALNAKYSHQGSPWWNQMPIASGMQSESAGGRRAIDLVHRHDTDGKQYDLVELKIDSDTPLFALTEILRYGLVYLVLREDRNWLHEDTRVRPIFDAEKIGLRVLAPQGYYKKYKKDLSWFESKINLALPKVIGKLDLTLTLAMDISSHYHNLMDDEPLKKLLDKNNPPDPLPLLTDWKPAYPL